MDQSFPVTLYLRKPAEPGRPDLWNITLAANGTLEAGTADLDLSSFSTFLQEFFHGTQPIIKDALAFGQELLRRLTQDGALSVHWAQLRHQRGQRPLCLDVVLPARAAALARLPFELLADDGGFLFRRAGSSVVRRLEGIESRTEPVSGGTALFAWANPDVMQNGTPRRLRLQLLQDHERAFADGTRLAGLQPRPPLRNATWASLQAALQQPTPLFAILAHGLASGEALLLENGAGGHAELAAADLARFLRSAQTRVALLWSCHAAEQDPDFGGVVEQLLKEGGLTAVLASHAAVLADRTPGLSRSLLQALGGSADGDFERALTIARSALPQDDLQWAVPTCYAPPRAGAGISFSIPRDTIDTSTSTLSHILNAPPPTQSFVGRETECANALALLRNHRVVSLEGMPGIGKTELARNLLDMAAKEPGFARFAWISLTGRSSLEALHTELALTAELESWSRVLFLRWLKTEATILILDNAEDLIRPAGAALSTFLDDLLRSCPGLRLLLTTQDPLPELATCPVRSLPLDRLAPPFDRQLFLDAAGSRLTDADRTDPALDRLISELYGHPRALRIVAGRTGGVYTLSQLRDALQERPEDLLVARELLGRKVAPGEDHRARSMVASLRLATDGLSTYYPAAYLAFCWLGLFPAGLPSELLPRVFGEEVEQAIEPLQRQHLLQWYGPDRRAVLPPPLRWWARRLAKNLADEQRKPLAERSAVAMWGWASHTYQLLSTRPAAAIERANADHTNLLELLDFSAGPTWAEAMHHACGRTADSLRHSHALHAAEALLLKCIELAAISGANGGSATSTQALGDLYMRTDRLAPAEQHYLRALELCRAIGDQLGEANAKQALGELCLRTARVELAEEYHHHALNLFRKISQPIGEANAMKHLGDLYTRTAKLAQAEDHYTSAANLFRTIDEPLGRASTMLALGDLHARRNRPALADENYQIALQLFQKIDDPLGQANTARSFGELHLRTAKYHLAEQNFRRSLELYEKIDETLGQANAMRGLGDAYKHTARFALAEKNYQGGLSLFQKIGEPVGEANALKLIGELYLIQNQFQSSEKLLYQAYNLFLRINEPLGQANTTKALGDLFRRTGRLSQAEQYYQHARKLFQKMECTIEEGDTLHGIGSIELASGRPRSAFKYYRSALDKHQAIGHHLGVYGSYGYLGRAAMNAGDARRSLALSGIGWTGLVKIEDRAGQKLALLDMMRAATALEQPNAAAATLLLACAAAHATEDSQAGVLQTRMNQIMPDQATQRELLKSAPSFLDSVIHALQQNLQNSGTQLLDDLPGEDPA